MAGLPETIDSVEQLDELLSRPSDRLITWAGRLEGDLMILGAGVHAREMAQIVERINAAKPTYNLLGFVSSDAALAGQVLSGYPVLGGNSVLEAHPQAHCAKAFCWPNEQVTGIARERLINLIDPSCFVSPSAELGVGCVLYPNCFVGVNARLGDLVFCLSACVINHDDVLEDRVTLASSVSLAGFAHVEVDCYLGQACTVRQGIRIGRNSLVGMGCVVIKDVPANSVMAGNPARKIKERT